MVKKKVSVIIKERQVKFKTNGMRALRRKANKKKGGEGKTQKTRAYGEEKPI